MKVLFKTCSKCKIDKEFSKFSLRISSKDGYRNQCKSCINEGSKNRRICGIYKITSPTGKIYIGQSRSIINRWSSYKTRGCAGQIILERSFKKHGVENHIFEIIEECSEEDLNCQERYWQDFYAVLSRNGLNCVLTSTNKEVSSITEESRKKRSLSKIGILNPNSKEVVDVENCVYYYTATEASYYVGININYLSDMLRGKAKNKTSLIYAEDYEKGFFPSTLFIPNKYKRTKMFKDGFGVIDFNTGQIIGSTKEVSNSIGMLETTLRSYLKGFANNPTNYIYHKDFNDGKTPKELCNNKIQPIKIININTMEVYNTCKEVCNVFNITQRRLKQYLDDINNSPLPLIRLTEYNI